MSTNEIPQTEKEVVRDFAEAVRSELVTMPEREVARVDARQKPTGYEDQGRCDDES